MISLLCFLSLYRPGIITYDIGIQELLSDISVLRGIILLTCEKVLVGNALTSGGGEVLLIPFSADTFLIPELSALLQ